MSGAADADLAMTAVNFQPPDVGFTFRQIFASVLHFDPMVAFQPTNSISLDE
jgi:hypothetical protein